MKKKICMILVAVFVAVLGTSTYFIIDHHKESNKQAALYGELADLVNAAAQTDAATEPAEQIPYSEEKMLLPELAELYQQNGDLVGWISIADTNINYPVMQSVNEPNFYLKHGFDKEYSDYGCPYVQEDCDVQEPSDNLVIYGHHIYKDCNVEEEIVRSLDIERVRTALKALTPEERDIIMNLYFSENPLSGEALAEKFATTKSSIYRRRDHALRKLKSILGNA